jgi:hypothetical protein
MALIQIRRGTAAAWASEDPTLESGELGLETDTGKTKVGNGATAWNSLSYNYVTYAQVDVAGATNGQTLVHNGTKFVPGAATTTLDTLTDVTVPSPSSGDFLKYNGSAWVNDPINLGTDTTGDYVQNLTAGTGVSLSGNSGEGATPTIAIGQAVATNSNVTFNDVTVSGNLTVSGTTTTISTETLTINDNIIVLNNNATGAPSENAGIEVERGSSTNVVIRWNESTDKWQFTNDGSIYNDIGSDPSETVLDGGTPTTIQFHVMSAVNAGGV